VNAFSNTDTRFDTALNTSAAAVSALALAAWHDEQESVSLLYCS
jgi:hypothetical protein|tara:strand:- start:1338 stop:1469 length:132 start_codon:yes stop_codon:yes gene_type:complete